MKDDNAYTTLNRNVRTVCSLACHRNGPYISVSERYTISREVYGVILACVACMEMKRATANKTATNATPGMCVRLGTTLQTRTRRATRLRHEAGCCGDLLWTFAANKWEFHSSSGYFTQNTCSSKQTKRPGRFDRVVTSVGMPPVELTCCGQAEEG